MTEGTSQGLFVVVAIVIFGIFVGLTYTLFGSEGLSNDLENIVSEAVDLKLENKTKNLINTETFSRLDTYDGYYKDYTYATGTITLTAKATSHYLTVRFLEPKDKPFVLGNSYKVTGNLFVDGKPVTDKQWVTKVADTHFIDGSLTIDNATGYFESVQKHTRNSEYILHTKITDTEGNLLKEGSKVEIKNLAIKNIDY